MDTDKLIAAAVTAVVGTLTKSAAEPILAAGGKAWSWLKEKLTGNAAATAAEVEADPSKPSARSKLTGLLQDLLHDDPAAVKELTALLGGEGGVQTITQTANVTGNNSIVQQLAGSGNTANAR